MWLFAGTEVAHMKPAAQGSTYNNLTASRALDGDMATCSSSVAGVRSPSGVVVK